MFIKNASNFVIVLDYSEKTPHLSNTIVKADMTIKVINISFSIAQLLLGKYTGQESNCVCRLYRILDDLIFAFFATSFKLHIIEYAENKSLSFSLRNV